MSINDGIITLTNKINRYIITKVNNYKKFIFENLKLTSLEVEVNKVIHFKGIVLNRLIKIENFFSKREYLYVKYCIKFLQL